MQTTSWKPIGLIPEGSETAGRCATQHRVSRWSGSVAASAALSLVLGCASLEGQTNYQQIMVFGSPNLGGIGGDRPLVWVGSDVLCGTTARDGWAPSTNWLFSLKSDGSAHGRLHSLFHGPEADAGLVVGTDGAVYGMNTDYIFKWEAGGPFNVPFNGYGDNPQGLLGLGGALALGPDGALFGTAGARTENPNGAVFRLAPDGSGVQIIHDFAGGPSDGGVPSSVIVGSDGVLYGVTLRGGVPTDLGHFLGTVFRLNPDGSGHKILHNFNGVDGAFPANALVQARDGMLYGTTTSGGTPGVGGLVYRLNTDGSGYAVIYGFTIPEGPAPRNPSALIQGPDGALYGTTQYGGLTNTAHPEGMGTVFKLNTNGSGYTEIHRFSGDDGRNPRSALLAGPDGALYGTTTYGGYFDQGTVFKLTSSPAESAALIDFYTTPAGFAITLSSAPARTWALQFSTDVGQKDPWHTVATVQTDAFGLARVTDSSGPGFYRAVRP